MSDAITIKEKIEQHFSSLSKAQQKVASFVLHNPTYIGVHSATEVGERAGTSETTVIRFCYAIGLNGYAQLQKELTMYLFEHNTNSTLGNYVSSKEELFKEQALCEKVMGQISNQIVGIAGQIDKEQFSQTTKRLHEAKTIYLVGAGASNFAAQWLQFTLNMLRPNVKLVQGETSMLIRTLQEADETAVAIVISLHRYYKEPVQIAEEFVKRGVYTVAITDANVAPIRAVANEAFVLQQAELSTIDMMPALISFLNTIVVGMMSHDAAYYNEQRVKFDDFQNSFIANRWS
ncbi:MurR/RpiR family transcriptional regulator [Lysinibacillus odysseyi]|uniref:Transcriptional regulator n=1 Tax=Lysinibacillus odysseyi 34hs-1 = NBRC 100172 TaxID=1220589 RepID=A0A0A3IDG5_9BACI|nr:MurR/RpiR family transcriptional regulator [Lysinibacillus odysseyi]KGR82781.1 transcriptional regulator [Lysinibacillus odysseyi 34hs-1 = NBRC 100172]